MGIKGNLQTMALPDVLQWLANAQGTGVLHVRSPKGINKRIFFSGGAVLSTASSDPREYLGQFLLSRGYLTEEQLNMAMETQLQTKIMLGKILTMVGILDEEELKNVLRIKAEESLYDLFLWEEGEFHFEDRREIEEDLVPISLHVMSLIMEGIRRKDEWGRIQKAVPSSRAVLERTDKRLKTESLKPRSIILRVYEALDGQRSIAELALHLHATEFDVSSTIYKFLGKGLAAIASEKPPADEVDLSALHGMILDEADKAVSEGRFQDAENLYIYAEKHGPPNERVASGLVKAAEGYTRKFFQEVVRVNCKLELAVPLQDLARESLTPQEGYIASRVNGDWDISSILKVSPLPEVEALKAIRKLLDKGLIRVKNR